MKKLLPNKFIIFLVCVMIVGLVVPSLAQNKENKNEEIPQFRMLNHTSLPFFDVVTLLDNTTEYLVIFNHSGITIVRK